MDLDLSGFDGELAGTKDVRDRASVEHDRAVGAASRADAALASLTTERSLLERDGEEIAAQLAVAVTTKLLVSADASAASAAKLARERSAVDAARADDFDRLRSRESSIISAL